MESLFMQSQSAIGQLRLSMKAGALNGLADAPLWWDGRAFTDGTQVWFGISALHTDTDRREILWVTADGDIRDDA